ncbi:hypothetical protein B0H12DRAFT_1325282 [Mycena haematopus]|nr:hypothetical protein B0H12DRAFT_1325282 [Mycena haematopus]
MAVTPASLPVHEENSAKPSLEDSDDDGGIADFLGIPTSESLASVASQYHSALSSPIPWETPEPSTERDLISFSSGNLARFVTSSEPLAPPPSPPFAIALKPPASLEFSSNRHRSEPLRKHELEADTDEANKTPNVYINGLPPHFHEDQLRAIAAPFGEIISVRCFTRNSTKSPSGYGFVLFKTIAAAEKCIVTLKRSDLHPSFSKVNKPPHLVHSRIPSLPTRPSSSSVGSDQDSARPGSPDLTFKAKMAQLEDKNSPNVYIEGLPMSADKNTLMEVVYPHVIQSTRFIRSKVPQSQTMIAFMRMETRAAAEDVIRNLNGKTRSEASSREDEPGRLSIAQATLLNYRAKELQSTGDSTSPLIGLGAPQKRAKPRFPDPLAAAVHELLTGNPGARAHIPPPANQCPDTLPHPLAANIHNLLGINTAQNFRPILFPQDPLYAPYACPPPPPPPSNMHPNVAALFHSLASMQPLGPHRVPVYPSPVMAGFPNNFNTNANMQAPVQNFQPNFVPGRLLRTPADKFVMQAQAELQSPGVNPILNTPALANRNMNPRLSTYLPAAPIPPQFSSLPIMTRKLPQRPAPPQSYDPMQSCTRPAPPPSFNAPALHLPPQPARAAHVLKPSIDIPQSMNNTSHSRPRQFSFTFPSSHARASTAPAISPQPNDNGIDHTMIPTHRERIFTSTNTTMKTNTNTGTNANTNSDMQANSKQNQNQNFPGAHPSCDAPETKLPPPVSTRVFLGPRNVLHLPLLRFT